jgi:SAM-dependent methyltransferase
MVRVSDYYNRYWTEEGYNPPSALASSLRRVYEEYVSPTDVCLDVGCGDGLKSGPWCTKHAASYVGVDVSATGIERGRRAGLDLRLVESAEELPFEDSTFDIAACVEVLEHLFDPRATCDEVRRVLKPDGLLIVTVPNIAFWRTRLELLGGRWNPGGDDRGAREPWRSPHIRFFTVPKLRELLEVTGFSVVEAGGMTDSSFLFHFPGLWRFSRGRPGSVYKALVAGWPALIAPALYSVARALPGRRS